jgi:hypothetical protein
MILEGVTYNTLLKIHTDEFLGKNVHERQTEIKKTSEAWNQKSTLRASKTRISQINSEMGDILLLKQYSDFPSEANYNQIHFDICNQILATDANQKLFNNSQRSRYHKGISAIHHAYNDTTWKTSIERALKRGGNAFSTIIKILEEEKGRLLADIKEKEEVIESKKQWTLATRKELHFFFERIYEEEYFNTVIQWKISKILIDILASWDLAGTIEKWIYSDFDMRKLKKLARAKDIHNFVKKEREYKQLLEKAKKKISAIHKLNHPEANVFTNAASEIGDTRKSLTDLKSQILSI